MRFLFVLMICFPSFLFAEMLVFKNCTSKDYDFEKNDYKLEVKKAINQSKIKISKNQFYETDPTKLTKQIEKITNYKIRKQNLTDEIKRVENSTLLDKEKQLEKLEKNLILT